MMKNQSELVKGMTDRELLYNLYLTQLSLLGIGTVLSIFLFDSMTNFKIIWEWDLKEILLYGGVFALIVIAIDLFLMKVLPHHLFDDGGINERVFQKRSYIHMFFLCWIIAFAEEWVFRGVIQTHFGLLIASVLFALLHIRYLTKWFLFTIVITISFLLGWLYDVTQNLFVTIFAHFLIDFVIGVKIRIDYNRSIGVRT